MITRSKSPQIKQKQQNLTFTSLESLWDPSSLRMVNRSTKKSKEVRSSKIRFYFLKNNFTNVPKMFIYISIGSNWDMSLSNVQLRKISKPRGPTITVINLKDNKNSLKCTNIKKQQQILWNLVVTVATWPKNKCLKLKPL